MLLTTSIGIAGGSEFFFFEITDSHALVTQGLNFFATLYRKLSCRYEVRVHAPSMSSLGVYVYSYNDSHHLLFPIKENTKLFIRWLYILY